MLLYMPFQCILKFICMYFVILHWINDWLIEKKPFGPGCIFVYVVMAETLRIFIKIQKFSSVNGKDFML